jgi:hypothetical protein
MYVDVGYRRPSSTQINTTKTSTYLFSINDKVDVPLLPPMELTHAHVRIKYKPIKTSQFLLVCP